jgi:hypothetical protein
LTRSSTDAQQQVLYLRRLPLQHLGHQVLGDRAVTAGELGDEPYRVGVPGEGQDGEAEPGRPALGPLMQHHGRIVGQRDAASGEELTGLVLGKAELRGANLGQLLGQPQPVQAQRQVTAGGHDRPDPRRQARQQSCELPGGLGRGELVQVIDDQDEAIAGLLEFGQHSVHQGAPARAGCHRRQLRTALASACRTLDRAQHGEPEELHIVLARTNGHERDPAVLTCLACPRAQQRCLPGAGRRRDDRDPLLACPVQGGHQSLRRIIVSRVAA